MAKQPDPIKQEEAHAKAGKATVKKFGPDWFGEEATAYYNAQLKKFLRPSKK